MFCSQKLQPLKTSTTLEGGLVGDVVLGVLVGHGCWSVPGGNLFPAISYCKVSNIVNISQWPRRMSLMGNGKSALERKGLIQS